MITIKTQIVSAGEIGNNNSVEKPIDPIGYISLLKEYRLFGILLLKRNSFIFDFRGKDYREVSK